jgi:hypothetical protein
MSAKTIGDRRKQKTPECSNQSTQGSKFKVLELLRGDSRRTIHHPRHACRRRSLSFLAASMHALQLYLIEAVSDRSCI